MNANELLPCPFCGSTEMRLIPFGKYFKIACEAPMCCYGPQAITPDETNEAWNTRPLEQQLAAKVREMELMTSWRPIESAPRDGTRIRLGNPKMTWDGYWMDDYFFENDSLSDPVSGWLLNDEMGTQGFPTHWLPLPKAPVTSSPEHPDATPESPSSSRP